MKHTYDNQKLLAASSGQKRENNLKFDPKILHEYCTSTIADIWRMNKAQVKTGYNGCHGFIDRGGDVLAVAHLDIAHGIKRWQYRFKITKNNVVYSVALDDRLGAYLICDYLPRLGLNFDVLLTENEEIGASTAADFVAQKDYNWIFEFDRRGNDVVLYEYDDPALENLLVKHGFRVGTGSFSDICYLENLGVKGMNFGTGYFSEHTMSCHANLKITALQVDRFAAFFRANEHTKLEHTPLSYAYDSYLPYGRSKHGKAAYKGYNNYDSLWDDDWYLSRTTWTDGKKREHWKRRSTPKAKKIESKPRAPYYSGKRYVDKDGVVHLVNDSAAADMDNHDPNKELQDATLPFASSIDEIDPIELDWEYVQPLYESARLHVKDLYGIDVEDLTWPEYCDILGLNPVSQHSWSDSDWIIWQVIGG